MQEQQFLSADKPVTRDQYVAVSEVVIERLKTGLPAHITYHDAQHTLNVIEATKHLIATEKVVEEERWLLLTASLFHDTGFLETYKNHEERSCEIAKSMLPGFGYSPLAIEKICKLIMATKLPQKPSDLLEKIICDADLYYLGSANFFRDSESLYKELRAEEMVLNREEWNMKELAFLNAHEYFTTTANAEKAVKKKEYLRQVRNRWKNEQRKQRMSEKTRSIVKDLIFMVVGVFVAGLALKGLLVTNHFFYGCVKGVSLLIHEFYHVNLAIVIFIANLPLTAVAYYTMHKKFAMKTLTCVTLLALCLLLVPFPEVKTTDKILIALFGGFFLGVGVGLCMRAGCALDGIEVLAVKTFKRTPFTVTEMILGLNILIFSIAAFELGIMSALYSILTYFTATKSIDYIVEGIEAYTGVTIISAQSDLLKHRLVNELGRGITVYKGERGFLPGNFETSTDCDIIFTVVTRLELRRLKNLVQETDANAFVFANIIREASGGILRRRQAHH
jgi:uncharacterized membrane-anchored protein YitT (DUF2179 family)/predicted metal-dependent HD superfamily phosphohydrolase